MKKTHLAIFTLIFISLLLAPACLCRAQSDPNDSLNKTQDVVKFPSGDLPAYLGQIIGAALALTGSIFLCLVIYGGLIIMTAAGNEDRAAKGKKIIYWAIIGVLIIGASYGITVFIFDAISPK